MTGPRIPQADPQERPLSLPLSARPDPWEAAAASPKPRRTHLNGPPHHTLAAEKGPADRWVWGKPNARG